jgi:hypothetical protein
VPVCFAFIEGRTDRIWSERIVYIFSQKYLTGVLWAVRNLTNTGTIAPTDVCSKYYIFK